MSRYETSLKTDIRAAMAALPEPERAVFHLCAVEAVDYPAVAERLGVSVAEVEQRLAAAIVMLGGHLEKVAAARDPVGSGAKLRGVRLHRLARWLGFG